MNQESSDRSSATHALIATWKRPMTGQRRFGRRALWTAVIVAGILATLASSPVFAGYEWWDGCQCYIWWPDF